MLPPSAAQVAFVRRLQTYFADRFIDIALIVGAPKFDARTLEGKWVRDEPFRFDEAGEAVATTPATTPFPVNGDFERVPGTSAPAASPAAGPWAIPSSTASAADSSSYLRLLSLLSSCPHCHG